MMNRLFRFFSILWNRGLRNVVYFVGTLAGFVLVILTLHFVGGFVALSVDNYLFDFFGTHATEHRMGYNPYFETHPGFVIVGMGTMMGVCYIISVFVAIAEAWIDSK